MAKTEDDIPPDVFFCPECYRPFTELNEKLDHLRESHPDHKIVDADKVSEIINGQR